jgi:membrane fusion protein (multidrug efflux system)
MKLWKQIGLLCVAGGLAVGGYVYTQQDSGSQAAHKQSAARANRSAPGVVVDYAKFGTVEEVFQAVGSARAKQSVEIVPSSDGRVEAILFASGDEVTRGQVLLRLEDRAELAALKESQATLNETIRALDRANRLRESGNAAESFSDQARAAFQRAEAQFDLAQKDLQDRVVTAPFGGTVSFKQVDIGDRVTTTTIVTTIDDLSAIEVNFRVPEIFYNKVSIGQSARARTSVFPDRVFEGRVTQIGTRIDESSRSFDVRVTIPNKNYNLPSGLFMTVELVLETRNSILIPETAIVPEAGAAYAYVVEDSTVSRRNIEIGLRRDGEAEIISGVEDGEAVIVRGVQKVRDGADVRIIDENLPTASVPKKGERS